MHALQTIQKMNSRASERQAAEAAILAYERQACILSCRGERVTFITNGRLWWR
jgi:hypothetical protein